MKNKYAFVFPFARPLGSIPALAPPSLAALGGPPTTGDLRKGIGGALHSA
jgi:hypothetical protein